MSLEIQTRRVYEPADPQDGFRVLVDRVWPRGLKKEQVKADLWLKEIAPSTALRKWFNHESEKWPEFESRYFSELEHNQAAVEELLAKADTGRLTLLYSARDHEFNQAVALKNYLRSRRDKH